MSDKDSSQALTKRRTTCKRNFTLAVNKLKSFLNIDEEKEKIQSLFDHMVIAYDAFLNANIECLENGIDDSSEDINNAYKDVLHEYRSIMKEMKEKHNSLMARQLNIQFERQNHILTVSIERLLNEKLNDKTVNALCEEREVIDVQLQATIKVLNDLSLLENTDDLEESIKKSCEKIELIKRNLNIEVRNKSVIVATSSPEVSDRQINTSLSAGEFVPSSASILSGQQNVSEGVQSSGEFISNTDIIQSKRASLPIFSGHRLDWVEFKCLWKTLAETQVCNKLQLAMELKRCCPKGRAHERLRHLSITSAEVYDKMWDRLIEEYEDPGLSVQFALQRLMSLKSVEDKDNIDIVKFIDNVEGVYTQLVELSNEESIHMIDIDKVSSLLPKELNARWQARYFDLDAISKLKPFKAFVDFLKRERHIVVRLAEMDQNKKPRRPHVETHSVQAHDHKEKVVNYKIGPQKRKIDNVFCVIHGADKHHITKDCSFNKLSYQQKKDYLKENKHCFKCLRKGHFGKDCPNPTKYLCKCGKTPNHHYLMCKYKVNNEDTGNASAIVVEDKVSETVIHSCSNQGDVSYYPVHKVQLKGWNTNVHAFMDGGSTASYITSSCAEKHKLKKINKVKLNISTVGGTKKEHSSTIYEVPLVTKDKKVVTINAYSLPKITNPAPPVKGTDLNHLFPDFALDSLTRPSANIDVLIGSDSFGLHPKVEIAKNGDNLSLMKGPLGVCLVGTHPYFCKENFEDTALVSVNNVHTSTMLINSHPALAQPHSFILGEELGIDSVPQCGSCRCGKCPLPGHNLSFREEQELELIRSGLEHDIKKKCWVTSYPWLINPNQLPENYPSALATLKSTEKRLLKDPQWAQSYSGQIKDMLDRGVAKKLSQKELTDWQGPSFYISHLAVVNEKSKSTPVRIVFNSSQIYQSISLNQCLAKGPDSFRNTILGILLRFRENRVALVGDIRKMFHSVFLHELEKHCHRFLWRDLKIKEAPDVYCIERVNMGDRCAPAVASEALMMTAELFENKYPRAAQFVKESTYVDDMIDSVDSIKSAKELASETELLLGEGNFLVKEWQFSGTSKADSAALKGEGEFIGVLGTQWNPVEDIISFQVVLNFSHKKRGQKTGPNVKKSEVSSSIPVLLTKRLVLSQVMSIYDPLGLVSPFTLLGKIYLRETWQLGLGWDDALPQHLYEKWKNFFEVLFQLEDIQYPRCIKPVNAVGNPWLILLSDGSDAAYGCVAYCRWICTDGSVVVRLIMAKSRIAPINKVSTPRMELNAAVVSKRCRQVIEKELRYTFDRVFHLLDSETVLHQLNKISTRFNAYEGVRIGEIQAACNGNMSEWAWLAGTENTSDWLTRGKTPAQLKIDSEWFNGPPMLYLPYEKWNIKYGKPSDAKVPGEKKQVQTCITKCEHTQLLKYENISTKLKAVRVIARLISIARGKSFSNGSMDKLTPALMIEAENFLIREAQQTVQLDGPNYKTLNPAKLTNGIWVVGASRLAHGNPLGGIYCDLPKFLPSGHAFTKLAMKEAHERNHRGRDSTLATFRHKFWTTSGSKLAKNIVGKCQLCILRNASLIEQAMGSLPIERITPSPPFNFSMLDLFGPYLIRGEVQKRISGKVWGVLFTDMVARAVHIEAIYGCDTESFLLALRRFVSVRGWPQKLYSDPGSQLVSAEKELKTAIQNLVGDQGLEWSFGVPDAPWHQGAVESLIKTVKKSFNMVVHNQRLSMSEFMTVCYEVANLINERPIGLLPDIDSNINVLTPNCMLLGRATASNPNVWAPEFLSLKDKCGVVGNIVEQFWKYWVQLFAPSLVYQKKWHNKNRELKKGDVVLVLDSDQFKGKYKLALVTETHISKDGKIRTATVSYKNFRTGEQVHEYKGLSHTSVRRSCHRLVLLVPVDE